MIFEPSGLPIPSEEEVRFEAREIVSRSGWGLPLIEALRKVCDPYWREAIARCLMDYWLDLVRDKDEQTYYYDMDGDIRYAWMDAEYDFNRIIRRSTHEQVDMEQSIPAPEPPQPITVTPTKEPTMPLIVQTNNGQIYKDCNVTIINGQPTVEPTMQQPQEASEQSAPEKAMMTSCLFTEKAIQEHKQAEIAQALERSLSGRNDKARALVKEVRRWQKEGYIDPNYNARVMYDELNKLIPIPFGYPGFRKYYNK